MARGNIPFLAFNRGIISPKAIARTDLDRTKLSAEVMTNWIPKTQGAMTLRPGTKYMGSSINDTGAEWIEFVAATDEIALLELTNGKMRIWMDTGDGTGDAHNLALLGRPLVSTTVSITDTGWTDASVGGYAGLQATDLIPMMTAATTSGVTISANSENAVQGFASWKVGDNNQDSDWRDTGASASSLPSWVKFDFGTGNTETVVTYTIRGLNAGHFFTAYSAPRSWFFEGNHADTGADPASWTTLDTGGDQTGWGFYEKRSFTVPSPQAFRFYRLRVQESEDAGPLAISEMELFETSGTQVTRTASGMTLVAGATGSVARARKRVLVDTGDAQVEHSLAIRIDRGPVTLRVGTTTGDDDLISETSLATGYHNLAFTPGSEFHITMQTTADVNRIVGSLAIGDSGTVEITAPWDANDLSSIRYDQSADVVYLDCDGVKPTKIERRGTGRSWSVVDYAPSDGPFLSVPSSRAKFTVSALYGNTTLTSDVPFFTADHVGALFRIFHDGQSGEYRLGTKDAVTDAIRVIGLSDTGTQSSTSERRAAVSVSGTYSGQVTIERSFEGADVGFRSASSQVLGDSAPSDTGSFSRTILDPDDNIEVWYRARLSSYTSGAAIVNFDYGSGGGVHGICRVTGFNSTTSVDIEVLSRFSDTGSSTTNWQEGYWSGARSFPTAVALHGGRLFHAQGGSIFGSVADEYESFDPEEDGDAAPIIRTLGSGPVDNIHYIVSLLRLIVGTSGAELTVRSSSLDEALTASNANAVTFGTQGAANMRSLKMDNRAVFVQRGLGKLFLVGAGTQGSSTFGDYESLELTLFVPELLESRVVSIAIQRQPETRIHCVLVDGTVAILTYEPHPAYGDVLCWSKFETDGSVEKAMVLPGLNEDAVFYHIRRTVGGTTKRFLEKWAKESECEGDTGLTWLMDCAKSFTDTGRTTSLTGFTHLAGTSGVVVWSDDTGGIEGVDRSADTGSEGSQRTYTVSGAGGITLSMPVHHAVAGLPYTADWKSTKLAYAAEAGTALAQMKRTDKIAFILHKTHNNGLYFGSDTGNLDPLPRVIDGAVVDSDKIHETFDQVAMPFPGLWDTDSRIHLRAKSPRPCTVLAAIPTVQTNEKV